MPTPSEHIKTAPPLRELSTPRAAALAGVLFAVLLGTTLVLIRITMPEHVEDSTQWLQSRHGAITTATVLMPFAGISFLWFIGVVRDGFGRYEDRFFLSVFLGSGLLFLAMMFVATAVAAGLVAGNTGAADPAARAEVIRFGRMVLISASQTYALRMAAVFMISLATIWLKTRLMPRWLVGLSYLTALALLIISDLSRWVTLAFPAWVLVVSGLLLTRAGLIGKRRAEPD
ncbi:hypothetical protein KO481_33775 [Nocardia sp. NEAU-G5]|uniref:DUF4386 family protein n=1 Tax=Nocardia albiluteola TaxID=2842303 RepID=A0ABS6BBD3_9NOCA|nr:hypothetical protein [Nocardia albiluteola]MBU3066479.1 hypothetical protein [Nocardia albiluteola]